MEPSSSIRKVAIIGAESTGKSALAAALAAHYGCPLVPEYAREYLTDLGRPYTAQDVETIARSQLQLEDQLAIQATDLLFFDTNLWVIKVWMEHSFNFCPDWVGQEILLRDYHLHIITDYNIPYEPDPLREHPEAREYFTNIYLNLLKTNNIPYLYVTGNLSERVKQAIAQIG